MSADGLIDEFKRLLSSKCGLPINKVCLLLLILFIYIILFIIY